MYLGRIVEVASAQEIYSNARHPYTTALLSVALLPNPERVTQRVVLRGEVACSLTPPCGCAFYARCPIAEEFCRERDPALRFSGMHRVACHKAENAAPRGKR